MAKKFELTFDANLNVQNMTEGVNQIQKALSNLKLPDNLKGKNSKVLTDLQNEINNFQAKAERGVENTSDMSGLQKSARNILDLYNKLEVQVKNLGNLSDEQIKKMFPKEIQDNIKAATDALKDYQSKMAKVNKDVESAQKKVNDKERDLNTKKIARDEVASTKSTEKADQYVGKNATYEDIKQKIKEYKDYQKETQEKLNKYISDKGGADKLTKGQKSYVSKLQNEINQYKQIQDDLKSEMDSNKQKDSIIDSYDKSITTYEADLVGLRKELEKLKKDQSDLDSQSMQELINTLSNIDGFDLSNVSGNIEDIQKALDDFINGSIDNFRDEAENTSEVVDQLGESFQNNRFDVENCADAFKDFLDSSKSIDSIKSKIQYFFSMEHAIELFTQAVRDAFNTIKELDAAMTETAVVTNYDIGDMWDQLPKYTKTANELGVTTQGAYETMTLFYQQGLNTNQAFQIGTETMKMARIAGLDYADATDRMTNALRGFNMELNDTSAQRVNDVYSELAAKTASNVDEISTAMTKTASLAHSAGMEFETTSAFLAQIIETTRESAETAGTALKTVIARFQSLEVDPSELTTEAQELLDGEEVDANKIETALRSVGVALRDSEGQFRDLDDVFLELASKWDGLDKNTQRYIATIAAGSRQQSRFIAMMQDYDRTMELVTMANNSAGASEEQFDKTLDSLESKLNQLTNAWNEFLMSMTNSSFVKTGVDILTSLINGINKITSGVSGAARSILSLGLAFAGLKSARAIISGISAMEKAWLADQTKSEIIQAGRNTLLQKSLLLQTANVIAMRLGKKELIQQNELTSYQLFLWKAIYFIRNLGIKKCTLIAIIIAAIVALVVIIKKQIEATDKKLKTLKMSADAFSQAADDAKSSIESLSESFDKYKELVNTFESLTEGTKEWRDALSDVNQNVLELISEYPELAEYLNVDKNTGLLSFEQDAYAKANAALEEKYARNTTANLIDQYQIADIKQNLSKQSFASVAEKYGIAMTDSEGNEILTADEVNDMVRAALAQVSNTVSESDAINNMFGTNMTQSQAEALIKSTREYDAQQTSYNTKKQGYESAVISASTSNYVKESKINGKNASGLIQGAYTAFNDTNLNENAIEAEVNRLEKTDLKGMNKTDLQEYLHELTGIDVDSLDDSIKNDKNQLKREIAKANLNDVVSNELDTFYTALLNSGLDPSKQETLLKLASDNGAQLTEELFTKLTNGSLEDYFEISNLDAIFGDGFEAALERSLDVNRFANVISSVFYKSFKKDTPSAGELEKTYNDFLTKNNQLTASQAEGFGNQFNNYKLRTGNDSSELADFFSSILSNADPENLEEVTNLLSSMDISDKDSIQDTFEMLGDLDISWQDLGGSAESAANSLIEMTDAVTNLDLDTVKKNIEDTVNLLKNITEREEFNKTFSAEDYAKLIAKGMDDSDFVYTGIEGEEYVYIGQLDTIISLLQDQLDIDTSGIDEQIAIGQATSELFSKNTATNFSSRSGNSVDLENAVRLAVQNDEILDGATRDALIDAFDGVIYQIGDEERELIPGIADMADEQIIEALKTIYGDYTGLDENEGKLEEINGDISEARLYPLTTNEINYEQANDSLDQDTTNKVKDAQFSQSEEAAVVYNEAAAALSNYGDAIEDVERVSKDLATEFARVSKGIDDVNSAVDDNEEALDDANKGSIEYKAAIHKIGQEMRDVYGSTVTDDFVEQNLELIDSANESQEAFDQLSTALLDNFCSSLNLTSEQISQLEGFAAQLDGVEINGTAYIDDSEYFQALLEMFDSTEEFEAYLATIHWAGDIQYGYDAKTGTKYIKSVALHRTSGGGTKGYSAPSSKSSGGGSEPSTTEWNNELDWLYNLLEDIAELERDQKKLEEQQADLLKDDSQSGYDLYELFTKQMANLYSQLGHQQTLLTKREQEMQEFMDKNSQYSQYLNYNWNDRTIEIDWDAIEAIQDKDLNDKVKDLVSEAEDIQSNMDDAEDAVQDIQNQIEDLEISMRETYTDFEQRVYDALVGQYQDVIDSYSDLNDTLTDSNTQILNSIQKEINLERQIRDNTDKEDDIRDTEARLAFLRRDTSGANDSEIQELEESLADAREEYEDTLIDQAIDRISTDNDEAAEQRQHQIDIMQAQLDYASENGEYWSLVSQMIADATAADGSLLTDSTLVELLKDQESWAAMSDTSKGVWEEELTSTFKTVVAELLHQQGIEDGTYTAQVANAIQAVSASIGSVSQAITKYSQESSSGTGDLGGGYSYGEDTPADETPTITYTGHAKATYLNKYGKTASVTKGATSTISVQRAQQLAANQAIAAAKSISTFSKLLDVTKYKTGGLSTETGPAWLDGTPSKPEYVLNADQTAAFLKLADVLPSIMSGNGTTQNQTFGSTYLNLTMNVDEIGSDYDVDRIADRVKEIIYNASSYRNVNVLNYSR